MSDTPEKIDGTSLDISAENRARLKALFPSVFTETVNDKGELVESVDFEKLKAELGTFTDLFEARRERYGMDWPGKKEALRLIQTPSAATLKPCREESVNFDTTENLFIEGDNLEVLKLLQKSYYGKVKMIYLDPPYNTGKEFIYPDNYSESLETYLEYAGMIDDKGKKFATNTANEGRFHTKWLNMMYPRLYLARNLLRNDGVVFVSIDDNEVSNLRSLLNDIFGEENIIGVIANVNNPKGRSDDKFLATAHEYVVVAAKNKAAAVVYGFEPEEKITRRYNKLDENNKRYREIDLRKTGDADRRQDRPDMFYYFYYDTESQSLRVSKEQNGKNNETEIIPLREDGVEGRWRWGFDTAVKDLLKLVARYMPNRKLWGVFEKDYLENRSAVKSTTAWTFKDVNSERGSEQLIELGFAKEVFPRPKPVGTMRRVLELGTVPEESAIVLDFFAGSCSIVNAAYELVAAEERRLNYIVVQLPERLDPEIAEQKPGYDFCVENGKQPNIAEIGKERIRRVINKLNEEQENKLDLSNASSQDRGFKVFKLDKSNFKQWQKLAPDAKPEQIEEQLKLHIDHIDHRATPEDLLFEILIKAGFMPTEKVQTITLADISVYSIAEGGLLICLADTVTKELINAVAEAEPMQFICLDKAFGGNDQLKANAVQTFNARNMGREKANQIVFRTV
jgi:adenine-specific DNA-methyltransferase